VLNVANAITSCRPPKTIKPIAVVVAVAPAASVASG
jgi:hypothetical protein